MNMKVGQGIKFYDKDEVTDKLTKFYGLIVHASDDSIDVVRVQSLYVPVGDQSFRRSYCYDESGANEVQHGNNVQLKDCPPPFTKTCHNIKGNVYAYANMSRVISFDEAKCRACNVQIIDGGKKISEKDMQTVLHHPWPTQAQKEYGDVSVQKKLQKRRLPAVADALDDMEKDSGMEY